MRTLDRNKFRLVPLLVPVFWLVLAGPAPGDSETGLVLDSSRQVRDVRLVVKTDVLPDFEGIRDIRARKLQFFEFLLPLVQSENQRLVEMRRRLEFIHDHVRFHQQILPEDRLWLRAMVEEFEFAVSDPEDPAFWWLVRLKVDTVPEELVLVQAAMESAWGTSRFAREGNNLFGQWCLHPGCGIVPENRPSGERHEVARFESVLESVSSYMRNLNTGRPYRGLREIRERIRSAGEQPDATAIAEGLFSYSERGSAYVREIRSMLRHNADVIDEARHLTAYVGVPQERS